ncbi:hypothetical protein IEE_05542 [Bacillus cereus BAG5X1-1]|uniref:Uncharacterized protein n=1 Tax=Bacillus cereus BAG5X1-1 TaxID=1053189 RepID=J8A9R8_BACCE|nr:hypothetical protein [Bacillus cereus]EJQ35324.1 hypothetical protein IEE_05542 [Bacillus cereus BAG5X1-1]
MARKKEEKAPHQDAITTLLKKEGKTYENWSRDVINENCLSLLQGSPSEWRNKMLEEASMKMLADAVIKQAKESAKPNQKEGTTQDVPSHPSQQHNQKEGNK